MKTQTSPKDATAQMATEFTVVDYRELQTDCARIAALGGEEGAIAADIVRISTKLWELCRKAEQALGR